MASYTTFRQESPKVVQIIRLVVVGMTLLFASASMAYQTGSFPFSPDLFLLQPGFSIFSPLQMITSSFIIPYTTLSFSMIFDLLLLNFIITPISSFVVSFQATKSFLIFLFSSMVVGALVYFLDATSSYSLFNGMVFAIVIFWSLIQARALSFFLMGIPISATLVVVVTTLTVTISPIIHGEWIKLSSILSMGLFAYLWAILRFRLKSSFSYLSSFEESMHRFVDWQIGKRIRALKGRLFASFLKKKP